MVKKPSRDKQRERTVSGDLSESEKQKPKRTCRKKSEDVVWVVDTTILDDDDSTYISEEDYDEFLASLLTKNLGKKKKQLEPSIKLTGKELVYFRGLPKVDQLKYNSNMKQIYDYESENNIPLRFRVFNLPVPDYVKALVLKKITAMDEDSGESYKLRNWVDAFLKIPFGKMIPLPVTLADGKEKCSAFIRESRDIMNNAVFGMNSAKTQIMQVISQWMANPGSVGNIIALHGPPGTGKTSLARNGISKALKRPFSFFSLGGSSDISNYVGHSYTYEGSMWGRIAESVMQSNCMNPVLYFDELDKVSSTPQGEEVISMLIHLTDRTQNTQFHDRFLSGIDLDLSQCLIVFSFNDMEQVNPILKDRMQVIQCLGYSETDKKQILKEHILPKLLQQLSFTSNDIEVPDKTMKFLISEYSSNEEGVRALIRALETILTRLNMIRIADEDVMKEYKFYIKVDFPLVLTIPIIETLMFDYQKIQKHNLSMYI